MLLAGFSNTAHLSTSPDDLFMLPFMFFIHVDQLAGEAAGRKQQTLLYLSLHATLAQSRCKYVI
jgi:hypothetical protein